MVLDVSPHDSSGRTLQSISYFLKANKSSNAAISQHFITLLIGVGLVHITRQVLTNSNSFTSFAVLWDKLYLSIFSFPENSSIFEDVPYCNLSAQLHCIPKASGKLVHRYNRGGKSPGAFFTIFNHGSQFKTDGLNQCLTSSIKLLLSH